MTDFHPITPGDGDRLQPFLFGAQGLSCEESLVNLTLWGSNEWAMEEGMLFLRRRETGDWLLPLGASPEAGVRALLRMPRREPLRLYGLTAEAAEHLTEAFPGRFRKRADRDGFDYIYDISRLITLRGKKLQQKRTHRNHFLADHPDYRVLPLGPDNMDRCRAFTALWYENHRSIHGPTDFGPEPRALERAFVSFEALSMEGILLEAEGEVVAFSMGSQIRPDTFDVHFEKALPQVQGAYPVVNMEFARRIGSRYPQIRYLNREDDMGIPGLRAAKESYFPDILLEKWELEEIV